MESFDLDHYELIVGNPTMNHTTKVDAGENAAIFLLVMKQENGTVVAHIRAVDRCGKESNLINSKLPISGLTPSSGLNSTSFTSCNCACIKKLVPSVIVTSIVTATIAIISVALVLIVLRQKQRCPTIFTTVNTKVELSIRMLKGSNNNYRFYRRTISKHQIITKLVHICIM